MELNGEWKVYCGLSFEGSIGTFLATHIWQTMTESKCKFFV
jgi:hypothetical protein